MPKRKPLPLETWNQTNQEIQLIFKIDSLSEVSNDSIKLKVAKKSLSLQITVLSQTYKYKLKGMYGEIVPTETSSVRKGDILTVVLIKKTPIFWKNLKFEDSIRSQVRALWINLPSTMRRRGWNTS